MACYLDNLRKEVIFDKKANLPTLFSASVTCCYIADGAISACTNPFTTVKLFIPLQSKEAGPKQISNRKEFYYKGSKYTG